MTDYRTRLEELAKRFDWWMADFDQMAALAEKRRDRRASELRAKVGAYRHAAELARQALGDDQ